MPNRNNAHYLEWEIWFDKMTSFISDGVILVGHSLGGIFLVKYLSENIYPKKIKALILVAAPFDTEGVDRSLGDFILTKPLEEKSLQTESIYLLFSKDDPVTLFAQLHKYQEALPNALPIIFENRKHFTNESFPEIIKLMKKI